MVTCEDFYEKWENVGNFCHKSKMTAKQVEDYIKYRNRYKLKSYSINRCALYPFMMIEDKKVLHLNCLKELRRMAKKIGGTKITRRLSIEIINKMNDRMAIQDRITTIPTVRTWMDGFQHEINDVSWEVRTAFDKLKDEINIHSNNDIMIAMINYCSANPDSMTKIKEMMIAAKSTEESEPDVEETDGIKMVKRT